jgi:radical SAM-linked protein
VAAEPDTTGPSAVQRLRVTFATNDEVKYVGHLDMARTWERAIRRSGLPLAYSQGFNPQARIQFAAALPLGFTGMAEIIDIYLTSSYNHREALADLRAALPHGIIPANAESVEMGLPALQAQVAQAHYRVEVETDETNDAFRSRLADFMARPEAWRERRRGKNTVRYDLRPLVLELHYAGPSELGQVFETLMSNAPAATGRPDELLAELGYGESARKIVRTRLIFAD